MIDVAIFVNRHFIIVKTHGKLHDLRIYTFNHAYVAVEYAASAHGLEPVRLRPLLLIVVLKLHHFVAFAINAIGALDFFLIRRGRIDDFLQLSIQIYRAGNSPLHRAKHLYFACRDIQILGQSACNKRNRIFANLFASILFLKEEIAALVVDVGHDSAVDFVRVGDDFALIALSINLSEITHVEFSAFDEIVEHVAHAHRSKLVFVPHKHQSRAAFHCVDKGGKYVFVHHTDLVHDDYVDGQARIFVVGEMTFAVFVV